MPIKLNVPYVEKDVVKKLGAVWDARVSSWIIHDNIDYRKFRQWIDDDTWNALENTIKLSFSDVFGHICSNVSFPFIQYEIEADVSNEFDSKKGKILYLIDNHLSQRGLHVLVPSLNIERSFRDCRIRVKGRLQLFPQYGRFQLLAEDENIEVLGICSRLAKIKKWEIECESILLKESYRENLKPNFSNGIKIGVITARNAEGLDDFKAKLNKNLLKGVEKLLLKEIELSSDNITEAINSFQKTDCDCICLIRGGGDKETLLSFSHPNLLNAMYKSKIPIITGVGHQRDQLLCKRVIGTYNADTPTGAAEFLNRLAGKERSSEKKFIIEKLKAELRNERIKLIGEKNTIKEKIKNEYDIKFHLLENEKLEMMNNLNKFKDQIYKLTVEVDRLNLIIRNTEKMKKRNWLQRLLGL